MKMPEDWRTFRVPQLTVLLPKSSFFIMWRHVTSWWHIMTSLTSWCHVTWSHTIGHNDFTWEFILAKVWKSHCDLDLWPTNLRYNPKLVKVKGNSHTKNQGHRSRFGRESGDTHRQKHGSDSMSSTADAGAKKGEWLMILVELWLTM